MVAFRKQMLVNIWELYESLPEGAHAEILEGSLVVSPAPTPRHSRAVIALATQLETRFGDGGSGPGGWVFLIEPALHLGQDVFEPDIAGWKRSRLSTFPEEAFVITPPDWVCEVLSPKTRKRDREIKLPLYASHSVKHAWLVDPERRTLEAFKRSGGAMRTLGPWKGNAKVKVEPFEAEALDLGRLWRL